MTPRACTGTRCCWPLSRCCSHGWPTWTKRNAGAVVGLDPSRAPTIVAGMILLSEAMRVFDLDEVEVSEHDILHGGILSISARDSSGPHGSSDI